MFVPAHGTVYSYLVKHIEIPVHDMVFLNYGYLKLAWKTSCPSYTSVKSDKSECQNYKPSLLTPSCVILPQSKLLPPDKTELSTEGFN